MVLLCVAGTLSSLPIVFNMPETPSQSPLLFEGVVKARTDPVTILYELECHNLAVFNTDSGQAPL